MTSGDTLLLPVGQLGLMPGWHLYLAGWGYQASVSESPAKGATQARWESALPAPRPREWPHGPTSVGQDPPCLLFSLPKR